MADADSVRGRRASGDRQQPVRKRDPPHGGREEELALYRSGGRGVAKCRDLLDHHKLPESRNRSLRLHQGCSEPAPDNDESSDRRDHPGGLGEGESRERQEALGLTLTINRPKLLLPYSRNNFDGCLLLRDHQCAEPCYPLNDLRGLQPIKFLRLCGFLCDRMRIRTWSHLPNSTRLSGFRRGNVCFARIRDSSAGRIFAESAQDGSKCFQLSSGSQNRSHFRAHRNPNHALP